MKLGATVWRDDATRGTLVRGPRRASRGMVWVQWTDRPAPQLWDRISLRLNASRASAQALEHMQQLRPGTDAHKRALQAFLRAQAILGNIPLPGDDA